MERITILENDRPHMGFFTRNITQGEEFTLVEQFIDFYCEQFLRNNKKCNLAIFIEPRVASGFPDIVFAPYLPSITDNWSDARRKLDVNDLKILSHLLFTNGVDGARLIAALKMPEKQTLISLEKLLDAKLIVYRNKCWKPCALRSVFSVKKLVSVEAKINNVNRAIEQSLVNTWFASHSYALTNTAKPHNETLKTFSKCGIGLYCRNKGFYKAVEAKQFALPSSYLSLQFNEWVGNSLVM